VEAHALADAAGAAAALLARGLGGPALDEEAEAVDVVDARLLDAAGVDHVHHVLDGDGRLSDVRRNHYLPHAARRDLEDGPLVGRRQ